MSIITVTKQAIDGHIKEYSIELPAKPISFAELLTYDFIRKPVRNLLRTEAHAHAYKLNMKLEIEFRRAKNNDPFDYDYVIQWFTSVTEIITHESLVEQSIEDSYFDLNSKIANWNGVGSQWEFVRIKRFIISITKYTPLRGGSYMELPKSLKMKKAIINVKNQDDKCFAWSILSALHPADKNADRTMKYENYINDPMFSDLKYPVAANANTYRAFEKKANLSINVFIYEKEVTPLYITKKEKDFHIDLLLLHDEKKEKSHYCWIKSFSRLMYDISKHKEKKHFCKTCLHGFTSEQLLANHKNYCLADSNSPSKLVMPPPGSVVQFKKYNKMLKVPFVIYADFESILAPVQRSAPSNENSYTMAYQKHIPCSFCLYVVGIDGVYRPPILFRGTNEEEVMKRFFEELNKLGGEINKILEH